MQPLSTELVVRCNTPPITALCVLLVVTAIGCDGEAKSQTPKPARDEFQTLLDASMTELKQKTEAHKSWGLGTFDRWNVDQKVGNLVFTNADGTRAVAPAQIIGTFNTKDNTWLWSWDNPSIVDHMRMHANKLKQYGEKHGIEKLTNRKWTGTEDDAWAMAALAVKLCGAQGAYRAPSGATYVFITFGEVNITKNNVDPAR